MMSIIADLQLHSRFARAVSPEMIIPKIAIWAKTKGLGLMATGDWTHPVWIKELQENLTEDGTGILSLKNDPEKTNTKFLLSGEVSCIYSQGGKLRRVHTLIFAPDFATVLKINAQLIKRGCNLASDGRPIIGLTSIQLCEVVFDINPNCLIIPAHAWTPWFSLYGSMSGFDSLSEAFGQYANNIYAIETGLSSDPAMNWRIKELDNRSILSFSDAHSGPKLGREATVFQLDQLTFANLAKAIKLPSQDLNSQENSLDKVAYSIEFYPEEGKYHFTGHRNCNVRQSPEESVKNGVICSVCGRPLTVGVMHRVEQLAGRSEAELKLIKRNVPNTKMIGTYSELFPQKVPYLMMVPLQEILAEALGAKVNTEKVQSEYFKLTKAFAGEFNVLIKTDLLELHSITDEKVVEAIERVREGKIVIEPGYDGVFGVVKIWDNEEIKLVDDSKKQLTLFN